MFSCCDRPRNGVSINHCSLRGGVTGFFVTGDGSSSVICVLLLGFIGNEVSGI
jgi:hypothetical protein